MQPTLQNVGSMTFVSYHFVKYRIKNGGMWLQIIAKIVGTDKYVGQKQQGRALDASLVTTDVLYQNI